ncbi:MAG: SdrD B-like domain-containing protein [Candidatus Omnitrophota bacterium]
MRRVRLFTAIIRCLLLAILVGYALPGPASAQYTRTYDFFLEKGKAALEAEDYQSALIYFEAAYAADPANKYLPQYINLIKRRMDDRVKDVSSEREPTARRSDQTKVSDQSSVPSSDRSFAQEQIQAESTPTPSPKPPSVTPYSPEGNRPPAAGPYETAAEQTAPEATAPADKQKKYQTSSILLDDEAWDLQPNTPLEIPTDAELIFRSPDHIKRVLVIEPDVLEADRIDAQTYRFLPARMGKSFLHIWDNDRRWTFLITVVPSRPALAAVRRHADTRWGTVQPFHFLHNASYDYYARGSSLDSLERNSYAHREWFMLKGGTPYGFFDAKINLYETQTASMEPVTYSMGLTDARLGSLRNFDIRIFDSSHQISPLTLPGRTFRGFFLNGYFDEERFEYTYLRGRNRSIYGSLSPGLENLSDFYIEAGAFSFRPDEEDRYTVNFARSWGEDKPGNAAERAYSVVTEKKLTDHWHVYSETGYDENAAGLHLRAQYADDERIASVQFRQIPRNYNTVTGTPADQGEVGTRLTYNYNQGSTVWRSYLDLYRDRENKNPDNPDAMNVDFSLSGIMPLNPDLDWRNSVYFVHTPGLWAEQTDYRVTSGLYKTLQVFDRRIRVFGSGGFQQNRYDSNPASDYDRTTLNTGMRLPLTANTNLSLNYDMYYIKDRADNETLTPASLTASLTTYRRFSERWTFNGSLYYRDEEDTEGDKSFLAGQDSLTTNASLTYRPVRGVELFCDARAREVWAESADQEAYTEADVRVGMRSDWELPFAWNPRGIVTGRVYKDISADGKYDEKQDQGIPGVKVQVGRDETVTDDEGWYSTQTRADWVNVSLDFKTLPEGFVVNSEPVQKVLISHGQVFTADFAIVSQSGIHGVVFVDDNRNGIPDRGEKTVPDVRLILDGDISVRTDQKGGYFFKNIAEGTHTVKLDIQTVPLQYLPTVKLEQTVEITEGTTYLLHFPLKENPSSDENGG